MASISSRIKAKAALVDPSRYGRSDRSPLGRWFWEIDKVLLLLVALLIGIGLIAVAAAAPRFPCHLRYPQNSSPPSRAASARALTRPW